MCKERQGLLPVCDEVPRWLEIYRRGFTAAILAMRGDDDSEITEFEMVLRRAGLPIVSIEIDGLEELGAEVFKWEVATALACVPLNVNPFDEPDVQENSGRVSSILEILSSRRQFPARTTRSAKKELNFTRKARPGSRFRL
jgi:transaldolase / glucose-6-phosphate isomerase